MSMHPSVPLFALTCLFAQTVYAQPSIAQAQKSGEQVYKAVCFACHENGVAQAPKLGDRVAWSPLIQEGQPVLTGHAWVGVRAMPARGGSTDLSLAEFSGAVAYMARASGANWKDPDSKRLHAIAREADKRLTVAIKQQQAMQRQLRNMAKPAK